MLFVQFGGGDWKGTAKKKKKVERNWRRLSAGAGGGGLDKEWPLTQQKNSYCSDTEDFFIKWDKEEEKKGTTDSEDRGVGMS